MRVVGRVGGAGGRGGRAQRAGGARGWSARRASAPRAVMRGEGLEDGHERHHAPDVDLRPGRGGEVVLGDNGGTMTGSWGGHEVVGR